MRSNNDSPLFRLFRRPFSESDAIQGFPRVFWIPAMCRNDEYECGYIEFRDELFVLDGFFYGKKVRRWFVRKICTIFFNAWTFSTDVLRRLCHLCVSKWKIPKRSHAYLSIFYVYVCITRFLRWPINGEDQIRKIVRSFLNFFSNIFLRKKREFVTSVTSAHFHIARFIYRMRNDLSFENAILTIQCFIKCIPHRKMRINKNIYENIRSSVLKQLTFSLFMTSDVQKSVRYTD